MHRHPLRAVAFLLLSVLPFVPVGFGQEAAPVTSSGPTARLAPGSPAPDFSLQTVNGETVRLSDFRGQTVLIHFWATWVGPCKITMPWLVDLQNRYTARGFHVLAVSLDDEASRAEIGEFADKNHMNFPVLIGNETVAKLYGGVPAMPESVLISEDGKVVERIVGLRSKSELEGSIKKAMNVHTRDTVLAPAAAGAQK